MFDSITISRTITTILNIYSKERSIGSNHEDTITEIIKSQFVFSGTNQTYVKDNFLLARTDFNHPLFTEYSEDERIKSDLRVLSIVILTQKLEIKPKNYKDYQDKIIIAFDKKYNDKITLDGQ